MIADYIRRKAGELFRQGRNRNDICNQIRDENKVAVFTTLQILKGKSKEDLMEEAVLAKMGR